MTLYLHSHWFGTYDTFAYVTWMLHERRTNSQRNLRKISPRVRRHISRHLRDVRTMFAQYSCEFLTTATAVRQLPHCRADVARLLQDVCMMVTQISCNSRAMVMRCNLEGLPSPAIIPSYCYTRWTSEVQKLLDADTELDEDHVAMQLKAAVCLLAAAAVKKARANAKELK